MIKFQIGRMAALRGQQARVGRFPRSFAEPRVVVQRHTHARQRASTCRDSHANAGAPCGHTRTRMHAVAPAARALSSCARRSITWQLQLSISTMLAMAHILLTTRDTSVTTTVRKRASHAVCARLRMRTPAESFAPAKYRRMHAAWLR